MNAGHNEFEHLRAEVVDLRARLEEAESTVAAIRNGDVDAIVVGSDLYTLDSANAADNRLRKDVLAQMEDAVLACDVVDHIIFMNAAAERLYRQQTSDMLGRARTELFMEHCPLDEAPLGAATGAMAVPRRPDRLRCVHTLRNGREIHVESTVSQLRDSRGDLLGSLWVVRDVSARVAAEATLRAATLALAQREREFSTLVQNSPDIFARFDRDLRYQYVSPRVERYTGIEASSFLGRTMAEVGMPAALCDEWRDALTGVFRQRTTRELKVAFVTPNERERIFRCRLMPEFNDDGSVESVLSIASDVTDQELVDAAFRENQARLQFTLESAKIGEWEMNLTSGASRTSLRHDRCFGYDSPIERWGKSILLSHVHPDDRDRIGRLLEACEVNHEDLHFECRVLWPDQSVHWIESHGSLHGGSGRALRLVGIVADTTDRKLAEAALVEADRRKDEFLATLAHELRNPLAPIRNALSILRRARDPDRQQAAQDIIERQLGQLVHLVDDLLDVSRISQGKLDLRREDADVVDLVTTAVETSRPLIDEGGHDLTLRLPERGALFVHADVTRICQTVANLLNNAARYTPPGGRIVVTVEADGADALIAVEDSGVGIPHEMLPSIFDMFTQVERPTDPGHGGLGIGLALVKKLVEMHGGSVEAHSPGRGRGCRFLLRLPLMTAVPDRKSAAPPIGPATAPGRRVLIADDNVDNAESLAELLSMLGYQTRTAHDGMAAVQAVREFRPEVAVLDVGMPRLDGHGAARQIRSEPGGHDLVLIAVSGWAQDEDRRKSHDAGFDHHFAKPVDLDTLTSLLATQTRRLELVEPK